MTETITEYKSLDENPNRSLAELSKAEGLKINNQEDYEYVGKLKMCWNSDIKDRKAYWEPLRVKAYDAYQEVLKQKREVCEPYEKAIEIAQKLMDNWATERKRIEEEEQAKLEGEARAKVEKERQRLLAQAVKLEEKGEMEKAKAKLEQAEKAYAPVVFAELQPKTIKVENGGSITGKNDIEVLVTNLQLLCAEIGDGRIPATVLKGVHEANLKSWVKLSGKKGNEIPGLLIKTKIKTSTRE